MQDKNVQIVLWEPDPFQLLLVRVFWESFFDTLDLEKLLKDLFLGGFDTFEDYEKYGDLFI